MLPPEAAALAFLSPPARAWFAGAFAAPTAVQRAGWPHIAAGAHTLLCAPTGSGKTLAAFLFFLDRGLRADAPAAEPAGVRTLYVSPLKALAYDIERNLRAPLDGIRRAAASLAAPLRPLRVAVRTGDTPQSERRRLLRDPGELLVTTPESLYLLLGTGAREVLRTVEAVIVDEIHALAPGKRGVHLALSLERLEVLTGRPLQRVGLSATQRPLEEVARYLGGDRPVTIVDAGERPRIDLVIEVPSDDMLRPQGPAPRIAAPPGSRARRRRDAARVHGGVPRDGEPAPGGPAPLSAPPQVVLTDEQRGMWPMIVPRVLELLRQHRTTIVFTNSRRLCERLAQRINDAAAPEGGSDAGAGVGAPQPLVRAHHGSIAREQREEIEALLKAGLLRGIVATSSLELGIDMSAVDLVVQIGSPGSVARGLQRIGRAGHQVGAVSRGRIFPRHRGDLLEASVVARLMLDGEVEPIRVPRNTLDVLAQQVTAMCADEPWPVARIERVVRRCHSFRELPRELLLGVLEMLAGRYPSDDFPDLRARVVWDRARDLVSTRKDARLVALLSGGTIPDRGSYAVHHGHDGPRVGELDEEMVHESRAGEAFLLGASSWRIVEITRDRVIAVPAPGEAGRMPFWRGEGPGRPIEVGRALGALVRALGERDEEESRRWLRERYRLDDNAALNLTRYLTEQRAATGELPSDTTIVIERFRDELGDHRVCLHSPFGARVHAPWAMAIAARLGRHDGRHAQTLWSDDGLMLRFGRAGEARGDAPPGAAALVPAPGEVEELVLEELGRSALFAARFRENAARALLLPRRRGGRRTPLWAQRVRSQALLAAARHHPDFPIVLETFRECLHDHFDMAALVDLLRAIERGEVRVVEVDTRSASPFARSLSLAWVAAYLYDGDAPLAERRAQALALDRHLLRELLGGEALRDLLDPAALDEVEAELQHRAADRRAGSADGLHDVLRRIGDLAPGELAERVDPEAGDAGALAAALVASGRAAWLDVAAERRLVALEDVARYRDALGLALPPGLPPAFLSSSAAPLAGLVARYARSHGPFTAGQLARRLSVAGDRAADRIVPELQALVAAGRLLAGEFRAGSEPELQYCDADVLRALRRRTLARLRAEVAPVGKGVLARFLPRWQGIGSARTGLPALREAIERLEGLALPLSELEGALLPDRVADFHPRMLDELGALGEIVWVGRGAPGGGDGRIAIYRRARVAALVDPPDARPALSPLAERILGRLTAGGACFFAELVAMEARAAGAPGSAPAMADAAPGPAGVLQAIWELVWAGLCTNDTFAPLRALGGDGDAGLARAGRAGLVAPIAAGRWSAVATLLAGHVPPTERLLARALMLLDRYGVVSREAAAAEGIAGGFGAIAPVLRAMEEAGRVRRGYFVEGLAGVQFAHAAAVERLRAARRSGPNDNGVVVALAVLDPANPYGALLPWPAETGEGGAPAAAPEPDAVALAGPLAGPLIDEGAAGARPRRVAGARLVMVDGEPRAYLDAGGRALRLFPAAATGGGPDDERAAQALAALRGLAARRRHRELRIELVNGVPALESRYARALERAGFRAEPGRLVLRADAPPP